MALESSKPKKQRKWHYTKPVGELSKDFGVHLDKELRKQVKVRSVQARKGDTVKIMRGNKEFVGKQGKLTSVLRKKRMVLIEGITKKKLNGTDRLVPFRPSNLLLVAFEDKDEKRFKRKTVKKKVAKDGE